MRQYAAKRMGAARRALRGRFPERTATTGPSSSSSGSEPPPVLGPGSVGGHRGMELLDRTGVVAGCGSLVFASETRPPIAPKFIESSAELGTITIEPFSFRPSNSIFIPLK